MEDIIVKFKNVHGDEYDYSLVDFTGRLNKVKINCKEHGIFYQTPAAHLQGQGCPGCGKIKRANGKKVSFEEFEFRARKIHGDKFSYDESSYRGIESPLRISCPTHGAYEQVGKTHLKTYGCPGCGNESTSNKLSLTREGFLEKAKKVHGDKFIYDKVLYSNNRTDVIITCLEHGDFTQKPNYHLLGNGCPLCGGTKKLTDDDFIVRSQAIHGDKYNYSLTDYQGNKKKVKIVCPEHGEFMQSPSHHLMGCGCPSCNESKGEKLISKILKEKNIIFVRQKRFPDCKNKAVLPFDFYLPDYNACIEFDGIQHFEPWRLKDSLKANLKLQKTQENDKIKNEYCQTNSIVLIRIKYNENIENKLNNFLDGSKQTNKETN